MPAFLRFSKERNESKYNVFLGKNFIVLFSLFCLFWSKAYAADFSNFYKADASSLKYFAKDMGTMLGSGGDNTARSLGFSGFDLGYKQYFQLKPDFSNKVFKPKRVVRFGWIQAEIGMPYRIDGFIKASNYDGLAMAGGGLRYGLRQISDKEGYFQFMLVGMSNIAVNQYFCATHFSSMFYVSRNGKYMFPYAGFGFDNTKLRVSKTEDAQLSGKKVYSLEERCLIGLKIKLRFFYLAIDAAYSHGRNVLLWSGGMRF